MSVEVPLTRAWATIQRDPELASKLKGQRRDAAKLLLLFVRQHGGRATRDAFRRILTRVEGFGEAYKDNLLGKV